MNQIRAFVGHSFTNDDAEIVRRFTDYFEQVSKSHPHFSWAHALDAEPKNLPEKVMALMTDKNVFIGICTRKERVIDPSSLTTIPFFCNIVKVREDDCLWKTSDWVIQEIGLAIGKGLSLILLVESGVRTPGGLQGSIEYINFERNSPEKCFGKLLEMIAALAPKVSSAVGALSEIRSPPPESENENESFSADELTPKIDWNRKNYEFAFMNALISDDNDKAKQISDAYLNTDTASQADNKQSWAAFCEYMRLRTSEDGKLETLKNLAKDNPASIETLKWLATGLSFYHEHEQSARAYQAAAAKADDDTKKLRLLGRAAVEYAHAKNSISVSTLVATMKIHVNTANNGELELLHIMKDLCEIENDKDSSIPILERILEITPDDNSTRFSLAYKYSDINNDLSLFHYLRIPEHERKSMAWNNLGVVFRQLDLPAKSVEAYRKAEEMGGTLAMSNIAQALIAAGFLDEAEQECIKAKAIQNHSENIDFTLTQLRAVPDAEEKRQLELLEKIKPVSDFYREYGRALSRPDIVDCSGKWHGPNCELEATLAGRDFNAAGSYEMSRLAGLIFLGTGLEAKPDRFKLEYSGTLQGGTIKGDVTRIREDEPRPSLLSSVDALTTVFMILSDDGSELKVMESLRGSPARFYSLKRKSAALL